MAKKIPARKELDRRDQWAIEDLYTDENAWQADLQALKRLTQEISTYAGKIGQSARTLLAYMRLEEQTGLLLDNLLNYAQRKSDEDTRVGTYQAMVSAITTAEVEAQAAGSFFVPQLLEIDDETLADFYRSEPELERYRRCFDNLRRLRAHILSPKEEKLLAAAGEMAQSPDTIFSMFIDADIQFPDAVDANGEHHPLTQGTLVPYLERADRQLRQSAYASYYRTLGGFSNTMAATLSAQVKQLQFFAEARNYPSALHASLDATNVPVEVYFRLIETVHQNMDQMHRYVDLRKRLLGLDALRMYDVYAPLVADVDVKIPYDQARQTVYEALAPLGEEYQALLRQGFENRWIDVYENVGKRSGAYSAGARVHPFVLLNYHDNLDGQFTLAHEMGHALHSYLSNRDQSFVDSDYVIFVAEVASTCNEALLMQHLLKRTTDKKLRACLINYFLEQFKATLYRQTMFAEFELRIAQLSAAGEALTADTLNREYQALNRLYFGKQMILDEESSLEWARIPHFYYNYYVFQYATGYAAAIALSQRILEEGEPAVRDYLRFLSGGCSKPPIELLKDAGVDMTTSAPVEQALALFGRLIDEMQQLMAE